MSNQPTDLQKSETQESFIEKTAKDVLSKTIAILLSGGIIAVLTILIAFVYGLPYYLYLPLGALAFFLAASSWYLISFRPTNKLLEAEIESLKKTKTEDTIEAGEVKEQETTGAKIEAETVKVRANYKKPILTVIFTVFIALCMLSAGILIGRYSQPKPNPMPSPELFANENLEIVKGKIFANERVIADGKFYQNCKFSNVTFVYNGTAGVALEGNELNNVIMISDNYSVLKGWGLAKGLGYFKDNTIMINNNKEIMTGVEAPYIVQPPKP